MMLPKDLLNLVFWKLEDGHDMINFSEISHRCHQIFHQNLEVIETKDSVGDSRIYTRQKRTQQKHGLYRDWWDNKKCQLYREENYYHGKTHGQCQEWYRYGSTWTNMIYHHGKLHGKFYEWYDDGTLLDEVTFYYGKLI